MSAQKTFSVLFEFEESKKQISIPNCDTEEVPENLLDILGDHLKRIDSNIRLVIDYGARQSSSSESQRWGNPHTTEIIRAMGTICRCHSSCGDWQR